MYTYKLKVNRVIDGDTVDGTIDLGFNILIKQRIRLFGINAPETRLQKSIKNLDERIKEKENGIKAKNRLKELLKEGDSHPEGLFVETFLLKGKYGRLLGDIKYIYARDLNNFQENEKPWIGWKSISSKLLEEGLVKPYQK